MKKNVNNFRKLEIDLKSMNDFFLDEENDVIFELRPNVDFSTLAF